MTPKYTSIGAIHIHTKFSDGTGDIEMISKAAKEAGLDWIIVSDHNDFSLKEGIYNDIYVIKAEEISPDLGYHLLAFDIKEEIKKSEDPIKNIENVHKQGGFCFAAHPDESDFRKNSNPPIKWLDKTIIPDGVELWNWFSDWANRYNNQDIFHIAYAFLFRKKLIRGTEPQTRYWWDKINCKKDEIFPAIAGTDAHALKINNFLIPVTIFPYKYCFKTAANLIYTDTPFSKNFEKAKKQILKAIKQGNTILINRKKCKRLNHKKLSLQATNANNETAFCGEKIKLDFDTKIELKLHRKAEISLFLDGNEIRYDNTDKFTHNVTEKGKYRIEVYQGNTPVLYSNPILIY